MRPLLLAGVAALLVPAVPAALHAQTAPPKAPDDRNTIIVTASPFATFSDNNPTIVAKVTRDTILATGGASIADSLNAVPGVSATSFAAGASRPIIRGQDANRVRLLEDGISSFDVSDIGPDHGIPIDPLAAQSIEVVRGPATLRYGSQAIGGVVNVLNNRLPASLPDRPFNAELDGSYGTVANVGEVSGLADVRLGDSAALHGDGFYRHAGDYDTPLGKQQNSYFRGYGGSVGGSYFTGDTRLGAAYTRYDADYGIPSDTTHIVMRQNKFTTRDSIALGGALKSLEIYGGYADYKHNEIDPDGTVLSTFRNKELDARAELLLNPIGPVQNIAVGVEVQRRRFSALGEEGGFETYLFPTLTQSEAAYLFVDTPVATKLHVQAAARVEHTQVDGTPAGDAFTRARFTPVSGSLGLLYEATPALKLGLTGSSTGRAPAQTELYARGAHDGPNTFETGDPGLKIERANSLEGTVRYRSGRVHFDGSLYATWFHDYIYGDLTGRLCDDDGCGVADGDIRELNYRQGGARFYGAEGEGTYDVVKAPAGTLSAKVLGDYTRATLNRGGNVPRIPPYRIGGGLTWASRQVDASLLYLYVGRQDRFGAFDTPTPHYNQLNAQLAFRPFRAHPGIELAVVGQNLTDDVQRAATALNKDLVVLPGRNVRFVLRVATF